MSIKSVCVAGALCLVVGGGAGAALVYSIMTTKGEAALLMQAQSDKVETDRRLGEQEKVANDAEKLRTQAIGDAFAARAAAIGLRTQLTAAVESGKHSALTGDGQAAAQTLDLLANMFSESDDGAGTLAAFADQAYANGFECAGRYDALNGKSKD